MFCSAMIMGPSAGAGTLDVAALGAGAGTLGVAATMGGVTCWSG